MNEIEAVVIEIESMENLNLVSFQFEEQTLTMISLDLSKEIKVGKKVVLSLKPTNITLAKELKGLISSSNNLTATIDNIEIGKLLTCITSKVFNTQFQTIITTKSLEKLKLVLNEEINLLFKASDLAILDILDD